MLAASALGFSSDSATLVIFASEILFSPMSGSFRPGSLSIFQWNCIMRRRNKKRRERGNEQRREIEKGIY